MSKEILPQEMFNELQYSSCIRTICPQEFVTDEMVARQVRRAQLHAGDSVLVQCFDHAKTKLLAEAEWRVISRASKLTQVEKEDFSLHQSEKVSFEVMRWTDWRSVEQSEASVKKPAPAEAPKRPTKRSTRWNSAKSQYDIIEDGRVIGFHSDKETAQRIADGAVPLPEMA